MSHHRILPFRISGRLLVTLVTTCCLGPIADASVFFSGDFNAGTGQVQFHEDYSFTLTSGLDANAAVVVVFDNAVTSDGNRTFRNGDLETPMQFEINGLGHSAPLGIFDNLNTPQGAMTGGDTYAFWTVPSALSIGDTLTVKAGTYGFSTGSGSFNPQLASLDFVGEMFLASELAARLSDSIPVVVPEPRDYAILSGAGLMLLAGFWRSKNRGRIARPAKH